MSRSPFPARLDCISQRWPPSIRREWRQYIRRYCREIEDADSGASGRQPLPYWLLLPTWLARKYNRESSDRISRKALNDILWAQYCVFLSIRIKDDLFDGQGISTPLFFVADEFLTEACIIFSESFRHSHRFWKTFTVCLQETIGAIWELETLQRRRRVSLKAMRAGYVRQSAVFKIGSAAVCHLAGRKRDCALVETAADHLAIAGQVLDDLQDIGEDLKQGRLNYAARYMIGSSNRAHIGKGDAAGVIAERLLRSDKVGRLLRDVGGHVQNADQSLQKLGLREAEPYFSEHMRSLEAMEEAPGRQRILRIFGTAR